MSDPNAGQPRPARRAPLLLSWVGPPPSCEWPYDILRLTLGRDANCSFLEFLPSSLGGRAFQLSKVSRPEEQLVYHVLVNGHESSARASPPTATASTWTACGRCSALVDRRCHSLSPLAQ